MHFQWYPGHMTKAKRAMQEDIKLIDVVIELVDARISVSSKNPDIEQLAQNKSRILLLNKSDMADPAVRRCGLCARGGKSRLHHSGARRRGPDDAGHADEKHRQGGPPAKRAVSARHMGRKTTPHREKNTCMGQIFVV